MTANSNVELMNPTPCPACASTKTVRGTLGFSGDDGWVTFFYPKGLRFFSIKRSVTLNDGQLMTACTACGHTWSSIDPIELRHLLSRSGDTTTRQALGDGFDLKYPGDTSR